MEKSSCVLVTDFDGTITKKDFFWYVVEKLLNEDDIKPWNDYLEKKITHFEALNRIFQNIHLDIEEFHEFIYDIPFQEGFIETINHCRENDIKVYIVSAGADYYINLLLEDAGIKDCVNLIANESAYSPETGLVMRKLAEDDVFYSNNYGIDKEAVAKFLRKEYAHVVFAGDGTPDYKAALHADAVFARGTLLDICNENQFGCQHLDSYYNVLDYLRNKV